MGYINLLALMSNNRPSEAKEGCSGWRASTWEFPKIRGPNTDPYMVGFLSQGHPPKRTPNL